MVRVNSQKTMVESRVNLFLLRVKKIGFGSSFVELGRVRKFWPVLPCLSEIACKCRWNIAREIVRVVCNVLSIFNFMDKLFYLIVVKFITKYLTRDFHFFSVKFVLTKLRTNLHTLYFFVHYWSTFIPFNFWLILYGLM